MLNCTSNRKIEIGTLKQQKIIITKASNLFAFSLRSIWSCERCHRYDRKRCTCEPVIRGIWNIRKVYDRIRKIARVINLCTCNLRPIEDKSFIKKKLTRIFQFRLSNDDRSKLTDLVRDQSPCFVLLRCFYKMDKNLEEFFESTFASAEQQRRNFVNLSMIGQRHRSTHWQPNHKQGLLVPWKDKLLSKQVYF